MVKCLENGIIPHVILPEGKDSYELEFAYEESEITGEKLAGTEAEDLKSCLRAGSVPEAYKGVIESAEVVEKKVFVPEIAEPASSPYGNAEEMEGRAREGYFVRDPERNLVYCPAGETLRQKSTKKNGDIRYANKLACRNCKEREKCYKGKGGWKEVDFPKDTLEKPNSGWQKNTEGNAPAEKKRRKGHYETQKVVRVVIRPDREKMDKRKCLSEHPFGTIKRAMDAGYYLLCGKRKVDGETALMCLGYNLKRALNLLGYSGLMVAVA